MWAEITRPTYAHDGLCYASALIDAEWTLIERRMPPASPS